MAEKINSMRKLVVSATLSEAGSDWEDTELTADLEGSVRALKQEDGGPIMIPGSRTVVQALLGAGLVDQLNLQVFPLVLGSGARVYPESEDKLELELASSQALDSGVVLQSYRPV